MTAIRSDFVAALQREERSVPSLDTDVREDRSDDPRRFLGIERRGWVTLEHDLWVVVTRRATGEVPTARSENARRLGDCHDRISEVVQAPQVGYLRERPVPERQCTACPPAPPVGTGLPRAASATSRRRSTKHHLRAETRADPRRNRRQGLALAAQERSARERPAATPKTASAPGRSRSPAERRPCAVVSHGSVPYRSTWTAGMPPRRCRCWNAIKRRPPHSWGELIGWSKLRCVQFGALIEIRSQPCTTSLWSRFLK